MEESWKIFAPERVAMGGRETIEKRREKLSAGTEKSDRQWEHVKGAVPKQWATKRISKIKKKESWAYLYQGCWRRQVSGICSINWDNCVQKVADRQGKKRWCYNLRNQI
jgi:hypothetical protein